MGDPKKIVIDQGELYNTHDPTTSQTSDIRSVFKRLFSIVQTVETPKGKNSTLKAFYRSLSSSSSAALSFSAST
jgi:hypothetical protein